MSEESTYPRNNREMILYYEAYDTGIGAGLAAAEVAILKQIKAELIPVSAELLTGPVARGLAQAQALRAEVDQKIKALITQHKGNDLENTMEGPAMTTVIKIDPELPCGTLKATDNDPYARCGRPASVAHAYPASDDAPNIPATGLYCARPGEWIIMPHCKTCAKEMINLYEGEDNE